MSIRVLVPQAVELPLSTLDPIAFRPSSGQG